MRKQIREPIHPGRFLNEEVLPFTRVTKSRIAEDLGISRTHLYDLLNSKKPVTLEIALRLEAYFDVSAETWLKMQQQHDLYHARKHLSRELKDIRQRRPKNLPEVDV